MSKALLASVGIVAPFIFLSAWAVWHSFRHVFDTPQERLLWLLFAAFVPFLGGLIYFLLGRRRVRGRMH